MSTIEQASIEYEEQEGSEELIEDILLEDGKRQIVIPEAITMTNYLFRNYRLVMYAHMNRCLRDGSLDEMAGFRILDHAINKKICRFQQATFWRINKYNFIADVDIHLNLKTAYGKQGWNGYITLWFDLESRKDKFTCRIRGMGPVKRKPDRELTMLSPFLVPYYTCQQMDDAADEIWRQYMPEALDAPECRNAVKLAGQMGLSIAYLPLYKRKNTDSILFFSESMVEIGVECQNETVKKEVMVPANTIVINSNVIHTDYSAFNIFHECFHDEYHYMFFRLQQMNSNDERGLKKKTVIVREDEKITNPLYWMELQANRGAYGLLMPADHTRNLIYEKSKKAPSNAHIGAKYEYIGKMMANELHLPYFRIRARMIQLGHIHAKGAMNFADNRMIRPFVFELDAWREDKYTFVIDSGRVEYLCTKDPELRQLMQSGRFVCADGHVVRNDSRFVIKTMRGLMLTSWAEQHVDQCCLRFVRTYVRKNLGQYVLGQMNYDADYIKQTRLFLEDEISQGALDELEAEEKYRKEFPDTFKEAFDRVRLRRGLTLEDMAEKLNMSRSTLKRWLREPEECISADFVMMVTLILKLPDWISELLFDRAYVCLSRSNKRHLAFRYIQRALWMDGIEKANEYLNEHGLEPLKIG
ncbi:MAG: helix-turn-helix transcriptional regulator [Eubacterium sp.]|nr:helix-turn-helix transcriptional regulator [Eubacterium sp.]